jgi:hypothetical protein
VGRTAVLGRRRAVKVAAGAWRNWRPCAELGSLLTENCIKPRVLVVAGVDCGERLAWHSRFVIPALPALPAFTATPAPHPQHGALAVRIPLVALFKLV